MKEKYMQQLAEFQKKLYAKNHLMSVLSFDGETIAPKGSADARGIAMSLLSEEIFKLHHEESTKTMLFRLKNSDVPFEVKRQVELFEREHKLLDAMPMDEYVNYQVLLNKSHQVWQEAKENSDFSLFKPYLEQIVETNRKIANYVDSNKNPYDVLLGFYEHGFEQKDYDPYFKQMQAELVPTIKEIAQKNAPNTTFLTQKFDVNTQKILSDRVMALMGIDRNYCAIAESEHPFTSAFNRYDVRITTHYYENMVDSSLYSVIHEGGHALYELNIGKDLQYTNLGSAGSLGLHESQSRFYENIIGKSYAFMHVLHPLLVELFPTQMQNVSLDELYLALNKVEASPIRIMADELTYSLHILIRYEIEKLLISGDLKVEDAPKYWNKLYKDHLGLNLKNDAEGILQDIHWAMGSFGYFPTYSLGSAYGAQMLDAMSKQFDVYAQVKQGNMQHITTWLSQNIHQYGNLYDPKDIIQKSCGASFNPKFYFDYLNRKFKAMYNIK